MKRPVLLSLFLSLHNSVQLQLAYNHIFFLHSFHMYNVCISACCPLSGVSRWNLLEPSLHKNSRNTAANVILCVYFAFCNSTKKSCFGFLDEYASFNFSSVTLPPNYFLMCHLLHLLFLVSKYFIPIENTVKISTQFIEPLTSLCNILTVMLLLYAGTHRAPSYLDSGD